MPVEFDRSNCQSNLTSRIGCKSIEITLYACLVESVELGVNPLRLHCLLKALHAGQIRTVELGVNPLRLHCMPAWSNQSIGCKSIEITLPVKGFRCQSNSTGRTGCKSIEITLYACLVESVKLGVNPLRLHCLLKALDAGRI